MNQPQDLLSLKQAVEAVNIEPHTLRRLAKSGHIKYVKFGDAKALFFSRQDLKDYLSKLSQEAAARAVEAKRRDDEFDAAAPKPVKASKKREG